MEINTNWPGWTVRKDGAVRLGLELSKGMATLISRVLHAGRRWRLNRGGGKQGRLDCFCSYRGLIESCHRLISSPRGGSTWRDSDGCGGLILFVVRLIYPDTWRAKHSLSISNSLVIFTITLCKMPHDVRLFALIVLFVVSSMQGVWMELVGTKYVSPKCSSR